MTKKHSILYSTTFFGACICLLNICIDSWQIWLQWNQNTGLTIVNLFLMIFNIVFFCGFSALMAQLIDLSYQSVGEGLIETAIEVTGLFIMWISGICTCLCILIGLILTAVYGGGIEIWFIYIIHLDIILAGIFTCIAFV